VTRFIAEVPFFAGRVKADRQLSQKDNGITTFSVLRASVVCFADGIGGVQYSNKPVPVAEEAFRSYRRKPWSSTGLWLEIRTSQKTV
jgi:hypothetical protein